MCVCVCVCACVCVCGGGVTEFSHSSPEFSELTQAPSRRKKINRNSCRRVGAEVWWAPVYDVLYMMNDESYANLVII